MKRYLPIIIFAFVSCLTACTSTNRPGSSAAGEGSGSGQPALGGNTRYTSTLPPPSDFQSQSAVEASTMRPPVRQ